MIFANRQGQATPEERRMGKEPIVGRRITDDLDRAVVLDELKKAMEAGTHDVREYDIAAADANHHGVREELLKSLRRRAGSRGRHAEVDGEGMIVEAPRIV